MLILYFKLCKQLTKILQCKQRLINNPINIPCSQKGLVTCQLHKRFLFCMADVLTKEQRHQCMSNIRGKNTKPELIVRKFLFSKGLRFRLHRKDLPGNPDIVLPKYKTVIFVNGCFWHGHEGCKYYQLPKSNVDFWEYKITNNKTRDIQNEIKLKELGWKVIRIWECKIRRVQDRNQSLERLYNQIVKRPTRYDGNEIPIQIAAEDGVEYGGK